MRRAITLLLLLNLLVGHVGYACEWAPGGLSPVCCCHATSGCKSCPKDRGETGLCSCCVPVVSMDGATSDAKPASCIGTADSEVKAVVPPASGIVPQIIPQASLFVVLPPDDPPSLGGQHTYLETARLRL